MEMDMEMDDEPAMGDEPAMADEPAMYDPMNREDEEELHERGDEAAAKRDEDDEDEKHDRKAKKNEELELDVIDDEALTEAVLARVVERLLKKN